MSPKSISALFFLTFLAVSPALAQVKKLTLEAVLQLAVENQPALNQSQLLRDITDARVKSDLSGWWPQAGVAGEYFRYFEQPVAIFPDFNNPGSGEFQEVRTGVPFNAALNFYVEQQLINNQLLLAKDQAEMRRREADQLLMTAYISMKTEVSKAFYEVLLSQESIRITEEDIQRQERQLADARALYQAGINDNIDYKRATITLQNTRAELFRAKEDIQVRMAELKALAGISPENEVELLYDLDALLEDSKADTLSSVVYSKRPEFNLVESRQELQDAEVRFFRRAYIPEVSGFFNYNLLYQTLEGGMLFNRSYPNSLAGLRLSFPIFQGGRRAHNIRAARLERSQLDFVQDSVQLMINREFQTALSDYKSNLYQLGILKDNLDLAQEIYKTVSLQYEEGIKNFLEVIQAETDLRTTRLNYYNALFRLMSSKMDLQRARGDIELIL